MFLIPVKRAAALLCAALLLTSLCGCSFPRGVELGRRLIVEAVGIDKADGMYTVTLQALDAHSAGAGQAPDEAGNTTRICVFTGETVAAALSGAAAATGLTPLYSQARVLVLGRTAAEEGLSEPLDFFLREYQTRSDILIAMAENGAAEIVTADFGETAPDAMILEEALLCGSRNGSCAAVRLYRFMDLLLSETDTAYCPVVGLKNAQGTGKKEPVLGMTAFFEMGRIAFTADAALTSGLLMLNGTADKPTLTVRGNKGTYTLNVIRTKTSYRFRKEADGTLRPVITVKAAADVTEFATDTFADMDETAVTDARDAGERYLKTLLNESCSYYYNTRRTDVCRLIRRVNLFYPKEKAAFCERLYSQEAGFISIEVSFTVRRTGKESL